MFTLLYRLVAISVIYLVGYTLVAKINTLRLNRKFKLKPFINYYQGDAVFYKRWYKLFKLRQDGWLIDYLPQFYQTTTQPGWHTFKMSTMGMDLIFTKDPENIKHMLATQFNDFNLGIRHKQMYPFLGDGIFTLDGEGWQHSRLMLKPQFSKYQINNVGLMEPHIQRLIDLIKSKQNSPFDIQKVFYNLTLDIASDFLFGESIESLNGANQKFVQDFDNTLIHISYRVLLQKFYWLYNFKKFHASIDGVHATIDKFVEKALNTSQHDLQIYSQQRYTLLYELVQKTRDPRVLRDQLLNILVAGRDTTAGLLSFTLFELSKRQDVFNKLKSEIIDMFDDDISLIDFQSLKSCKYLQAVVNEVLRLYPSVPINFRAANKNTTLPKGGGPTGQDPILIRRGDSIIYTIGVTQKDEHYYGSDSLDFNPDRWLEERTRKLGWAYLPFNGGPRICLGQQFAIIETSYVIVRLLQTFDNFELMDNEYPPRKIINVTMDLLNGCNVKIS